MSVRRAIPGDEPALRAVRLQAMTDAPDAFGSTYERELARTSADWSRWLSPGATFLLEESGEKMGIVAGGRDADDSAVMDLMAMWIHPTMRGSGAAAALVESLIGWARTEGASIVRLQVVQSNTRACRFYERQGFVSTGLRSVRQRDGELEMRMERMIAKGIGEGE